MDSWCCRSDGNPVALSSDKVSFLVRFSLDLQLLDAPSPRARSSSIPSRCSDSAPERRKNDPRVSSPASSALAILAAKSEWENRKRRAQLR